MGRRAVRAVALADGSGGSKGETENDRLNILKLLIHYGARVSVTDRFGNTPLHYAAKCSGFEVAKVILQSGSKVSPRNKFNETPLDYAVDGRIIQLLKKYGSKEN